MNIGIFTGRLGRDAELRHTPKGDDVTNFALAVDVGTKANPQTMWIDCQVWGSRAAPITPYLLKGTKVTIQGRISLDEYTKKDGTNAAKIQVSCNEVDLHGGAKENAGKTTPADSQPPRSVAPVTQHSTSEVVDDDIPF